MAEMESLVFWLAVICLGWSLFILIVQTIGVFRLVTKFSSPPSYVPIAPTLPIQDVPHITLIRPIKGLDASLHECLSSGLRQRYPHSKISISLCVETVDDPAYPVVLDVARNFSDRDIRVYIEQNDDTPSQKRAGQHSEIPLGPNPKIRNMRRAYNEAKGDLIWIVDCNVWLEPDAAGRMVDLLEGFQPHGKKKSKPYKLVHQLPIVVNMPSDTQKLDPWNSLDANESMSTTAFLSNTFSRLLKYGGGRLDEMFMATSHAKFYSAINTVLAAPCIIGKSNMFRKSHLDRVTNPALNPLVPVNPPSPTGLDYFAKFICEDHLVGDLLWRSNLPGYANHGMVDGSIAIQPLSDVSVAGYTSRRARWLTARKWTVLLATLVEPGTEPLLCSAFLTFGLLFGPEYTRNLFFIPPTSWNSAFPWYTAAITWHISVVAWIMVDWGTFQFLHSGATVPADASTPSFALGTKHNPDELYRTFCPWLLAWIVRNALAFPIWFYAVMMGSTLTWRGKTFHVNTDMRVIEKLPSGRTEESQRRRKSSVDTIIASSSHTMKNEVLSTSLPSKQRTLTQTLSGRSHAPQPST